MRGTVRTLASEVRDMVEVKVKKLVSMTAQAHDCVAEIIYERGYPVTVNAEQNTGYAAKAALAVAGSVDTDTPPIMAAEDFSYMLKECPGACIMTATVTVRRFTIPSIILMMMPYLHGVVGTQKWLRVGCHF